jgi:hypothetical protein
LQTCGDGGAGLGLLRASGWLDGTELGRTGTGVAVARDVEAAGAGQGPLGRLSVGGDEGKLASGVKSGRIGTHATRSGAAEGDTGAGSTGTVGGLAKRFVGSVGVSVTGGNGVQARGESVGRVRQL